MVLSQMKKFWEFASTIGGRFSDHPSSLRIKNPHEKRSLKTRKLLFDPLESRELLSLSVGTTHDILVNPSWQDIRGDIASATNEAGDLIVTWAAADPIYNPQSIAQGNPQPLKDKSGNNLVELNVYARYLTNEVQRLTLDSTLKPATGASSGGTFEFYTNPCSVQRLTFTTATNPTGVNSLMVGTVNLGLWIDNQLVWGYSATDPYDKGSLFTFNENLTPGQNAANLQTYLRTNSRFLGRFTDVEAVASGQRDYDITFVGYEGVMMQEMMVRDCNFTSGFMGGAIFSTINTPTRVTTYNAGTGAAIGITVSSNPWTTAASIQNAINSAKSFQVVAPNTRLWRYDQVTGDTRFSGYNGAVYDSASNWTNNSSGYYSEAEVRVTPVTVLNPATGKYELSTTVFDIEFVGVTALQDVQELQITQMYRRVGTTVSSVNLTTTSNDFGVETIKQSSPVFRVNAVELPEYLSFTYYDEATETYITIIETDSDGNPIIVGHGKTNQMRPVVAMDNNGDFTIAWESEVKDITQPYNYSDIYVRRFTAQGIVSAEFYDEKVGFYVDGGILDTSVSTNYIPVSQKDPYQISLTSVPQAQGVRPLGDQFRVNVDTNGTQTNAAIAADMDGNFVVTWTSEGQASSYFWGIRARWFEKTGLAITGEIAVTTENGYGSPYLGPSYVAMSRTGETVILYNRSVNLYKSVYGRITSTLNTAPFVYNTLVAADAFAGSIAFDMSNRYYIAYTQRRDSSSMAYTDIYGIGYQIVRNDTDPINPKYSETCYTSGDGSPTHLNPPTDNQWYSSGFLSFHMDQGRPSVGMDADGDLFVSYQGYGPDVDYLSVSNNISQGGVPFWWMSTDSLMSLFFQQDYLYFHRKIDYVNRVGYAGKNDDLLGTDVELADLLRRNLSDYDVPSLYTNGILYKALDYAYSAGYDAAVDCDGYVRAVLIGATKAGANADQLGRLNAMLTGLVGDVLAGAGNDILYTTWSTPLNGVPVPSAGDSYGVVNNQRDGNNAKMMIAVPVSGLESATMTITLHRDVRNEYPGYGESDIVVTFDVPFTDGFLTPGTNLTDLIRNAFNAAGAAGSYRPDSFLAINVSRDTLLSWQGTPYAQNNFYQLAQQGFQVYEITFQLDAHDCPWTIMRIGSNYTYKYPDVDPVTIFGGGQYMQVVQQGNLGQAQINSHVAMTNSGNVAVVWSQQKSNITYDNDISDTYIAVANSINTRSEQIYLRTFVDSTDTAGPTVTQVALPDGTRIENGDTVTSAVKNLVISFDEALLNTKQYTDAYSLLHAVDRLDNWALLCDGVMINGAIDSIIFGRSISRDMAQDSSNPYVNGGTLALGSNRWEAVITFKDGYELTTGNYTLVAKGMIQDIARNALNSTGRNYTGDDFRIEFSVVSLNVPMAFGNYNGAYVPENTVSRGDIPGSELSTRPEYIDHTNRAYMLDDDVASANMPNTPNSVACDANGNFVVVWTATIDETLNPTEAELARYTGVWVKIYRENYVTDSKGKRVAVTDVINEFRIEGTGGYRDEDGSLYYARQASVAMSDSGIFAVVWDHYNLVTDSREVYANRFSFNGEYLNFNLDLSQDKNKERAKVPFQVNGFTENDQQNASVAIDSDGDIIIVWESFGQDDEQLRTWGIYGRRFLRSGYAFDAASSSVSTNTIQQIDISGTVVVGKYSMKLTVEIEGIKYTTESIPVALESATNIRNIKAALLKLQNGNLFTEGDLAFTSIGSNVIQIEFKGKYADESIVPLTVAVTDSNPPTKIVVNVSTISEGGVVGGEFLVNTTVTNHQRYPSVAMDTEGNFVVSWTSWGQDDDEAIESNIYAKRFVSNSYLTGLATYSGSVASGIGSYTNNTNYAAFKDNYSLNNNAGNWNYTGVGMINVDDVFVGTGSLLYTRNHVITAAHLFYDATGTALFDLATKQPNVNITITFEVGLKQYIYTVAEVIIHPDYRFNNRIGTTPDIAVIRLVEEVKEKGVESYRIYENGDELGRQFVKVGYGDYGLSGTPTGVGGTVKHWGNNVYEITAARLDSAYIATQLVYDFDDGTITNDYIGNHYGIRNLGVLDEMMAAPGDSGGPSFIGDYIAGITAWGNSAYPTAGDYAADIRVAAYSGWINAALMGNTSEEFLVNKGVIDGLNQAFAPIGTTVDAQKGNQIWSSVAYDSYGHFIITWTGYNQDAHGDSITGPTNNGLGGIFARRFYLNSNIDNSGNTSSLTDNQVISSSSPVFMVSDYTGGNQTHSQVSASRNGDFVITWESYKDRDLERNDVPISYGIYAKRYVNTKDYVARIDALGYAAYDTVGNIDSWMIPPMVSAIDVIGFGKLGIYGEIGDEFCVENIYLDKLSNDPALNKSRIGDQLGASVALNANGDMVFVWTNLAAHSIWEGAGDKKARSTGAQIISRTVTLGTDATPPIVTSVFVQPLGVNDPVALSQVKQNKFKVGEEPLRISFTFSELMLSAAMVNAIKNASKPFENRVAWFKNYSDVNGKEATETEYQKAYSAALMTVIDQGFVGPESGSQALRSVLNPSNWSLLKDGSQVFTAYQKGIRYSYDAERGCLVLTIDFTAANGKSTLQPGSYVLTLSDNVADQFGNRLDGDYNSKAGGSYSVMFVVEGAPKPIDPEAPEDKGDAPLSAIATHGNNYPDVASWIGPDGKQYFVVVGTSERLIPFDEAAYQSLNQSKIVEYADPITGVISPYILVSDIVMYHYQEYDDQFVIGSSEIVVTNEVGNQLKPSVAANANGSIVVAWTGAGTSSANGVYAKFYINNSAKQVFVNESTASCSEVRVAISGEYVLITWMQASYNNTTLGTGDKVMGRLYQLDGTAVGEPFLMVSAGRDSINYYDIAGAVDDYTGPSTNVANRFAITWSAFNTANVNSISDIHLAAYNVTTLKTHAENKAMRTVKNGNKDEDLPVRLLDMPTSISGFNSGGSANSVKVNRDDSGQQDDPQIAMDKYGNIFVVWTSTLGNNIDIYGRAYTASGGDRAFSDSERTGSGSNDYRINTYTDNSQMYPDISVSPDGKGFLVTWTSYGQEKNNYDAENFKNLNDFGIFAKLYNSGNGAISVQKSEWNVNTIRNGNQLLPACTIFNGGVADPHFVITWTGPNKISSTASATDPTTTTTAVTAIKPDADGTKPDYDAQPGARSVYLKYYPVEFYGGTTNNETNISTATVVTTSKGVAYSGKVVDITVNPTYYSPQFILPGTGATGQKEEVASVFTITGTAGNDTLVFNSAASISGVSIMLNGKAVVIPVGTTTIEFNGLGGTNTVTINGSTARESVAINAARNSVTLDSSLFSFLAGDVTSVLVNAGAESDTLFVQTSKGNDTLTLSPGKAELGAANGFSAVANLFKQVAGGSSGGVDIAIMKDSQGDDQFTFANGYAKMNAAGYVNEVYGFNSVRAVATTGNDTFEGTNADDLVAIPGAIVAQLVNGSGAVSLMNFDSGTITGRTGSAASLIGSTGDDFFEASQQSARLAWSGGSSISLKGFNKISVNGVTGNDTAYLSSNADQSVSFTGKQGECSLVNGSFTKSLTGFSKVTVAGAANAWSSATLYDTGGNDLLKLAGRNAVLSSDGNDIYQLLAFDQVTARKTNFNTLAQVKKDSIVNIVFETDSWETIL